MIKSSAQVSVKYDREKLISLLEEGDFSEAEEYLDAGFAKEKEKLLKNSLKYLIPRRKTRDLANKIGKCNNYLRCELTPKTITLKGGSRIRIPSFYALSMKKKMGPKRAVANGRGKHLLLSYWGFIDNLSPGHWEEIARAAAGSASFALAQQELNFQGIPISQNKVEHVVKRVGEEALKTGAMLLCKNKRNQGEQENFKDKRICITIDGGRIRIREWKEGRPKKNHGKGFATPWIEPKLLCIYELNEKGEKKKDTDPLYFATIEGPDKLFDTLLQLSVFLNLKQATSVICSADGSDWIWNLFEKLIEKLEIKDKTTLVADYFHAVEHLTEIVELNSAKSEKEKQTQIKTLAAFLKQGKFDLMKQQILNEAKTLNKPEMKDKFNYFEKRKERMRYDQYLENNIPIGSGAVESAVKRVINQRIKSAGSFWLKESVERFLFLRCALISGRWKIFTRNLIDSIRLTYNNEGE